jgi:hypothetical protein
MWTLTWITGYKMIKEVVPLDRSGIIAPSITVQLFHWKSENKCLKMIFKKLRAISCMWYLIRVFQILLMVVRWELRKKDNHPFAYTIHKIFRYMFGPWRQRPQCLPKYLYQFTFLRCVTKKTLNFPYTAMKTSNLTTQEFISYRR